MAVVAATAIFLAFYRPIFFLALVAAFSFYFAFRGYRVLSRKRPQQGQGPKALDWAGLAEVPEAIYSKNSNDGWNRIFHYLFSRRVDARFTAD